MLPAALSRTGVILRASASWRRGRLRIILAPFFARWWAESQAPVLEKVFRRATVRARIESNPIGPILRDYVEYLVERGHKASPLHQYVFAVEHFGRWVRRRPIDDVAVDRFIE